MNKVVIIGNGNVAHHLYDAFLKAPNIEVSKINSRKFSKLPKANVYIIAVADDAIAEVSSKITNNTLVVHTSGSVSLSNLKNKGHKGVFYMLQSFSKNTSVDFSEIPFCLEAQNQDDLKLLETLATSIGKKVYHINSEQRKRLHIAAVFVNNFTNHLYKIAYDICEKNQVPFEILYPLIKETAAKIEKITPQKAQTGPAIRNDLQTIDNHLTLLEKHQQEIYTLLTASIQHGKKL